MAFAPQNDVNAASFTYGSDRLREEAAALAVTSGDGQRADQGEGLSSPRLGVIRGTCQTCQEPAARCPGHRGVTEVGAPLQHPLTVSDVRFWLRTVCFKCGGSMLPPEALEHIRLLPRTQRLREAGKKDAAEGRTCRSCGAVHPRVESSPDDNETFRVVQVGSGRPPRRFLPGEIRPVLERVDPALVELLTPDLRQHPANLLVRAVAVPPTTVRPQVRLMSLPAADQYGALTAWYARLVMTNRQVPAGLGGAPPDDDTEVTLMAMNILYSLALRGSGGVTAASKKRGASASSNVPNGSLLSRLRGKTGAIRLDTLGARAWLIARSTISGNSELGLNQVAVPVGFARIFEVEETVTPANLARLTAMFLRRDPREYPRVRKVLRRATGRVHNVGQLPDDVLLEEGDVAVRDACDGDVCFFNRQPSLERSSITALNVVVMRDPSQTTFQFNVVIASLFNADFKNVGVQQVAAC